MNSSIANDRIEVCNPHPVRPGGDYVLYWMTAFRRVNWNFSLQRAAEWSRELGKPLVVLEALRCDYPWASRRLHRFVLEGMGCNAARLRGKPVFHYPYVEPCKGAGGGLLRALAERSCLVITDDYPCFFLPRMLSAAAKRLSVKCEKIDSNGLLPMRAAPKTFLRAYDFRRFLQSHLAPHLASFPAEDPLSGPLPKAVAPPATILRRWEPADSSLSDAAALMTKLPIDSAVPPVAVQGGAEAARKALDRFVSRLEDYREGRNHPDLEATSRLSPWLHFGHISAHQVFRSLPGPPSKGAFGITRERLGKVDNWWNLEASAQAFADQLLTWREIGFNYCHHNQDYDRYESLPEWAQSTLAEHANDARPVVYRLDQFERAETHDPLWNAAQRQLLVEGRIHNYMRMLWGKKILHWSASPTQALEIMIELNNKYALDGRDPNSYSGIFWCLGRYDRAWGPERPIFGKIRYMSSESAARKLRVKEYLERYQG